VCSLISIPAGGGRQLLGAAYADASLRLWSVPKQACVLHEALKPDLALAPSRLRYAPPPADEPGRPGKLLVQLDAPSAAAGGVCGCGMFLNPAMVRCLCAQPCAGHLLLQQVWSKPVAEVP
jgi:hypothetical protein